MKRIKIITIYDENNYGNRLQNYAVQEFLKKNNFEVETIKNHPISNKKEKNTIKRILRYIKANLVQKKFELKKILKRDLRYRKFKEFNKNIKLSKRFFSDVKFIDRFKEEDIFVVGSDQVWNPNFGCLSHFELVEFQEKATKISLSASFGISSLPEECKEKVSEALKKFKAISVREDVGKEIAENLTNRKDIEVLVDPTMLLSTNEWNKVCRKPEQLKDDKYILNYFLGDLSDERKKEIERIAKENNCEIINILDKNSPFYLTGPSEFLYLEKNAFLVCTDSFHSCIFAILYNTPFIVYDREQKNVASMNSRIKTLLSKFKLDDRYIKDNKIKNKLLKSNFTESHEILKKEREKAKRFLERVLN